MYTRVCFTLPFEFIIRTEAAAVAYQTTDQTERLALYDNATTLYSIIIAKHNSRALENAHFSNLLLVFHFN